MTKQDKDEKSEKADAKRVSPDKPLGETTHREEDFYEKQRKDSPDGMTPHERDQWQKGAPGALDQKSPDGEKLGEDEDIANPPGGTAQSGGR